MNKDKNLESLCASFEFLRSESTSQQDKMKEFWKYLDSREVLEPYKSPECKHNGVIKFKKVQHYYFKFLCFFHVSPLLRLNITNKNFLSFEVR